MLLGNELDLALPKVRFLSRHDREWTMIHQMRVFARASRIRCREGEGIGSDATEAVAILLEGWRKVLVGDERWR